MLGKSFKKQKDFGVIWTICSMPLCSMPSCQHVLILRILVKCCTENASPSQAPALGEVHHMQVKAVKYL